MDELPHDQLAEDIGLFRRAMIPQFLLGMLRRMGDAEPNLLQVASLYVLDGGARPTVGDLAGQLGRSTSVTSRLVDQLVRRGWIERAEDLADRRAKRLRITPAGRDFLRGFERVRAQAQRELMTYLTDAEQRRVAEAMALLGKASRRHLDERDADPRH
ncbi:MarR family winged helix-turn-helix transcriptional regulator [Catellatospora tritici]|uniref:MarR family winged helix-turn-helix transcriptional regulator n=1 Tax=Catellatospora tritici TaxID=2851566 RepID=UPI001C2CEAB6|nr:MarR family transcriptional regulator [Catellatospora tritici]MBV1851715.1 winged helix DNA-binding protein [Catellatospora tritici]